MRYDMKYKKLNVEDNESCNLQCEKKCEKLAGVFICCILAFFLLFLSTRNVGLIYCYADELSEDSENTAEDAEQEQQKIKETILSEFEYGEIDDSLRSLFPEKRIAFQEVIRNFNRRSEIFRQTSYRICRRTDALSASDREEKSGTYFADRNDRSIHESVRGYPSEPTGGKCRFLYDLYIIGGTDGCGIRCGYSVGGIRDT